MRRMQIRHEMAMELPRRSNDKPAKETEKIRQEKAKTEIPLPVMTPEKQVHRKTMRVMIKTPVLRTAAAAMSRTASRRYR